MLIIQIRLKIKFAIKCMEISTGPKYLIFIDKIDGKIQTVLLYMSVNVGCRCNRQTGF